MKTIPLTQGYSVMVDDCDYELLQQWKWNAVVSKKGSNIKVYAGRNPGTGGNSKFVSMHRLIVGAKKGECVDHKNLNTLDNQRLNLRICSHQNNTRNQNLSANNKSGFKGVHWCARIRKWMAKYTSNKKDTYIGIFNDPREAAAAYDSAVSCAFGEFAKTNRQLGLL